jgi:hypothetical protein
VISRKVLKTNALGKISGGTNTMDDMEITELLKALVETPVIYLTLADQEAGTGMQAQTLAGAACD